MRTLLSRLFLLGMILVFVGGCNLKCNLENELIEGVVNLDAKTETTICPPQDIVEWLHTPYGLAVIQTDKNFYSEKNHSIELFMQGQGWITVEEYKELEKQYQKEGGLESI